MIEAEEKLRGSEFKRKRGNETGGVERPMGEMDMEDGETQDTGEG